MSVQLGTYRLSKNERAGTEAAELEFSLAIDAHEDPVGKEYVGAINGLYKSLFELGGMGSETASIRLLKATRALLFTICSNVKSHRIRAAKLLQLVSYYANELFNVATK